jgi:hypothetical protein
MLEGVERSAAERRDSVSFARKQRHMVEAQL